MSSARRRADDPEEADYREARLTLPLPPPTGSLQRWVTGVVAASLIGLLAFFAGRDRKSIDDDFAASQADRAAIHLSLQAHETQLQLMKQQIDLMQRSYERLFAQAEEQSRKLDQVLREVKR